MIPCVTWRPFHPDLVVIVVIVIVGGSGGTVTAAALKVVSAGPDIDVIFGRKTSAGRGAVG